MDSMAPYFLAQNSLCKIGPTWSLGRFCKLEVETPEHALVSCNPNAITQKAMLDSRPNSALVTKFASRDLVLNTCLTTIMSLF
jgi:hypothetical protein